MGKYRGKLMSTNKNSQVGKSLGYQSKATIAIALGLIIIVFLVGALVLFQPKASEPKTSPTTDVTIGTITTEVSSELTPYIQINQNEIGQEIPRFYYDGYLTWIGSPSSTITSIQDVHLLMYTQLNRTDTIGSSIQQVVDVHILAFTGMVFLPSDVIDKSQELVIPQIGASNQQVTFDLDCSSTPK